MLLYRCIRHSHWNVTERGRRSEKAQTQVTWKAVTFVCSSEAEHDHFRLKNSKFLKWPILVSDSWHGNELYWDVSAIQMSAFSNLPLSQKLQSSVSVILGSDLMNSNRPQPARSPYEWIKRPNFQNRSLSSSKEGEVIVNVPLQLWRWINKKERTLNITLCDNRDSCWSWCQIRICMRRL